MINAHTPTRKFRVLVTALGSLFLAAALFATRAWTADSLSADDPRAAISSGSGYASTHSDLPEGASAAYQESVLETPPACYTWSVSSSPNQGTNSNYLRGVVALSANNVWAVGSYGTNPSTSQALILHWNGSQWSVSPSPSVYASSLSAVTALSANDIWAVGNRYGVGGFETLVEHWNGSQWSVIPSPNVENMPDSILYGIDAISANDIWAVGYYNYESGGELRTLTMHWDGAAWSIVPSPNVPVIPNKLYSVSGTSANDVWAVGDSGSGDSTLVLHWDGAAWSIVPSPNPTYYNRLRGVVAISPTNAWAVGAYNRNAEDAPLIIHWDGTSWTQVTSPYPPLSTLHSVAASAANDVWAVGKEGSGTLTMHWDGDGWSQVSSPAPGSVSNILYSVSALPGGSAWAVGDYSNGNNLYRTLVEQATSSCITPSPTGIVPTATPTPGANCTPVGAWSEVLTRDPYVPETYIESISAASPTDIWAAGYYVSNYGRSSVFLHWNGTDWGTSPVQSQPGVHEAYDVAAIAPNNAYAVGYRRYNFIDTNHIFRWDGSMWSTVNTPSPGAGTSYLYGISALSANEIWAVGKYYDAGAAADRTLIMRWNGAQWSIVPSPNVGQYPNVLRSVRGLGSDNVWAVGHYATDTGGPIQTLIMRWNGAQWSVVASPNAPGSNFLARINGNDPSNLWAVGHSVNPSTGQTLALTMRWKGTVWTLVATPNPGNTSNVLGGVSVLSVAEAWAVGSYSSGTNLRTLVLRWDGLSWSQVTSPNPSPENNSLRAVLSFSEREAWAVGYKGTTGAVSSLALRYRNSQPCPIPVPPRCHGERFTDVCPSDYFYTPVLELNNEGIISGYNTTPPCDNNLHIPCFKPYTSITRSQVAKIVSLAAGFSEPVTGQSFEDVPPSYTFYQFIERMASRGIIGGYSCGGVNEPCIVPRNLPYFRPGTLVTRGQLSKMVAQSFGFNEPVTGQSFEDVSTNSTFYLFVERMAGRQIISGYPCGAQGEPCIPSANRPYFRPNNPVTRGQTSKMVHLARSQLTPTPITR